MKISIQLTILSMKLFKFVNMKKRTCDVTNIKAPVTEFYSNQSHLKAVDNFRRNNGVTKKQLAKLFRNLNSIN